MRALGVVVAQEAIEGPLQRRAGRESSFFGALRVTTSFASALSFSGFAPRRIGLPLLLKATGARADSRHRPEPYSGSGVRPSLR
jgi:hypothetical protein